VINKVNFEYKAFNALSIGLDCFIKPSLILCYVLCNLLSQKLDHAIVISNNWWAPHFIICVRIFDYFLVNFPLTE